MSMYQEEIMDHYQYPRNQGLLPDATETVSLKNPLCGDELIFSVKEIDGKIAKVGFSAKGCAISVATASMLSEYMIGKSKDTLQKLDKNFIVELLGIELSPNRLKCALLSLEAMHKCLIDNSKLKIQNKLQ